MSKNKSNLQKVFEFTELLNAYRDIIRLVYIPGKENKYENDVEHSYMLAMLADHLISLEKLSLDRHKVMHYCLVHDFVEVYAGDTNAYSKDKKVHDTKHHRELEALKKLIFEFPEHMNMWKTIEKYELRLDEESRFVYALDKVQPTIQTYLDGGKWWKQEGVTLSDVVNYKKDKVKFSPIVEKYWNELREILERNQHTLFPH